ncbi:hypothetical protein J3F83DRAFT_754260 [Trichoderma novae-zelandiae]
MRRLVNIRIREHRLVPIAWQHLCLALSSLPVAAKDPVHVPSTKPLPLRLQRVFSSSDCRVPRIADARISISVVASWRRKTKGNQSLNFLNKG